MRQISLLLDTAYGVDNEKRRCGRPSQNWLHFSKKLVYEQKSSNFKCTGAVQLLKTKIYTKHLADVISDARFCLRSCADALRFTG